VSTLLSRPFLAIVLAQTCFGFAFSCYFLLPKFVTQKLREGPGTVGLVMASFGATSIVFIPVVGALVDRVGRRGFMTAGALVMLAACLGFLLVDGAGPLLYGLRMVQGVSFAMTFIAGSTLVTDEAPPDRLGQALGIFGVSILAMHAVAPAVAEEVAARAGWPSVFWMSAAGAALSAAFTLLVRDPRAAQATEGGGATLLEVALRGRTLRIGAVVALTGAAFGAMMTYPQAFALEQGRSQVKGFFVAYAGAAIVIRIVLGGVADRWGRHRVSIGSLAVYAAVVLAMSQLRPWALEPLGLVFGAAHGLFYPALNALAVESAKPDERGKVMALFNGGFNAGNSTAVLALGFVAERAGYPLVFGLAGAGVALALAVLALSPEGRGRA
jgi:MFS family permease